MATLGIMNLSDAPAIATSRRKYEGAIHIYTSQQEMETAMIAELFLTPSLLT